MPRSQSDIIRAAKRRQIHAGSNPDLYMQGDVGELIAAHTLDKQGLARYPKLFEDREKNAVPEGESGVQQSPFDNLPEELKDNIIIDIRQKILESMDKDHAFETDDGTNIQTEAPQYLIAHKTFRQIVLSALRELDQIPITPDIHATTISIRRILERQGILSRVTEVKIKNKTEYISYVVGHDQNEVIANTMELEALIEKALQEMVHDMESYIIQNFEHPFSPHTFQITFGRRTPKKIFNCIFVRLIKNKIIVLPEGDRTDSDDKSENDRLRKRDYSFHVDAVENLRKLVNSSG